jgi:hypothetical protein
MEARVSALESQVARLHRLGHRNATLTCQCRPDTANRELRAGAGTEVLLSLTQMELETALQQKEAALQQKEEALQQKEEENQQQAELIRMQQETIERLQREEAVHRTGCARGGPQAVVSAVPKGEGGVLAVHANAAQGEPACNNQPRPPGLSLRHLGELETELMTHICCFLDAKDLSRLASVSRSFGCSKTTARQKLSVVGEAAQRWVLARTAEEQAWVAHWPRWLRRMHEILHPAAIFSRSHSEAAVSQCGGVVTRSRREGSSWYLYRTAASATVMRQGRHYAVFTVAKKGSYNMFLGLIRPSWDVNCDDRAYRVSEHCFYSTNGGQCFPRNRDWMSMQSATEGDKIGLLLSCDSGSLTVFKNGERLGVMATGLDGEYSWAVSMAGAASIAHIQPDAAPSSPTAEEVVAASAFHAQRVGDDY